ncbi:hypothetical protein INT47_007117, partial [Mucor saturninus]
NLLKACARPTVRVNSQRCFSVSKHYFAEEEEERPKFSTQRIEDIIAEFEKPLVQSDPTDIDPRTTLLYSVEKFKPRSPVISQKNMDKLRTQLHNAYTVDQLATIVIAHKLKRKGLKKGQLINSIIEKHWGIKTAQQLKEEEMKRQLDIIKQTFPASRQELFFIIGDNGSTIRNIEQENQVKVTIDVQSNQYIVEGPSAAVVKAKREILTHLNIIEDTMDIPTSVVENSILKTEISNSLVDISKVAGTFITMDDNRFILASISDDAMENAKRLLSLMLKELDATSDLSNKTVVHDNAEFTVLPLHDPTSMTFYDKKLNWSRLEGDKEVDGFKVLGGEEEIANVQDMKQLLLKPLGEQDLDQVTMEARFGHLLFQNANITKKISATEVLNLYKNRTLFFPTMPPRQLTSPFIPMTLDGGFHQRSVQLSYTNKSLLEGDKEMDLKKLHVEFIINENGDITLKNITGIKNQSVVDILGIYGNVDIRLLAKQAIDFSDNEELITYFSDKCELTSYSELKAPKSHVINDESSMILSDITFLNKKRFMLDTGLVGINYIQQQDKRVSRTEMIVNSVDPETLKSSNSIDRWPSFSNVLSKIASRWDYSI